MLSAGRYCSATVLNSPEQLPVTCQTSVSMHLAVYPMPVAPSAVSHVALQLLPTAVSTHDNGHPKLPGASSSGGSLHFDPAQIQQ
jgi:hypothetical protein